MRFLVSLCLLLLRSLSWSIKAVSAESDYSLDDLLDDHDEEVRRVYPKRTVEEAAVLEWGNSAIITALDASVALFGPQTTDAALLEVETAPILAKPLDGMRSDTKQAYQDYLASTLVSTEPMEGDNDSESPPSFDIPVGPLDNADEITGNLCIMTTHEAVSGVELALMAQASGAAALLVVNIQDTARPDDIHRLPTNDDPRAAQIDIPVVMISLNSAQMLATALLDPNDPASRDLARRAGFSTKYMPERVRLYAGDDRPFFEDVEAAQPTIYLIHDLFKTDECDTLIQQAETAGLERIDTAQTDPLQYTHAPQKYRNVERVTLWQGLWMTAQAKQMEERIEQVTSFPVAHYSDFVIDRIRVGDKKSYIQPHYDDFTGNVPIASMTIFLSEPPAAGGGDIYYPHTESGVPIHIRPRKGMAVIHHNTIQDRSGQTFLDEAAKQGLMAVESSNGGDEYFYVAHKYIFMDPVSNARRIVLPIVALPTRGRLPGLMVSLFEKFVDQFGYEQGSTWFDKACIFVPALLVLMLVQVIVERVQKELKASASQKKDKKSKKD